MDPLHSIFLSCSFFLEPPRASERDPPSTLLRAPHSGISIPIEGTGIERLRTRLLRLGSSLDRLLLAVIPSPSYPRRLLDLSSPIPSPRSPPLDLFPSHFTPKQTNHNGRANRR